jgi:hypothetical protein
VLALAETAGLKVETGLTLSDVGHGAVTVTGADGARQAIACGAVVLAPGRKPYDPLSGPLLGTGVRVQTLGDVREPRSYGNAIHEAAYLARHI